MTNVLLLHSSGMSGRQWRRLVTAMRARGWSAEAPDLTGHGAAAPWPEGVPFSFRTDVDGVVNMLRTSVPATHLVGHSYGGLIALEAARIAPEHVASIVAYDPVAFGVLERPLDDDALADLDGVDVGAGRTPATRDAWLESFVDYWSGPGAWRSMRPAIQDEFRRVGWIAREGARSLVEDPTRGPAFAAITAPVHLLSGGRSPLAVRRVAERLAASLPSARRSVVADAGHMAPLRIPTASIRSSSRRSTRPRERDARDRRSTRA